MSTQARNAVVVTVVSILLLVSVVALVAAFGLVASIRDLRRAFVEDSGWRWHVDAFAGSAASISFVCVPLLAAAIVAFWARRAPYRAPRRILAAAAVAGGCIALLALWSAFEAAFGVPVVREPVPGTALQLGRFFENVEIAVLGGLTVWIHLTTRLVLRRESGAEARR